MRPSAVYRALLKSLASRDDRRDRDLLERDRLLLVDRLELVADDLERDRVDRELGAAARPSRRGSARGRSRPWSSSRDRDPEQLVDPRLLAGADDDGGAGVFDDRRARRGGAPGGAPDPRRSRCRRMRRCAPSKTPAACRVPLRPPRRPRAGELRSRQVPRASTTKVTSSNPAARGPRPCRSARRIVRKSSQQVLDRCRGSGTDSVLVCRVNRTSTDAGCAALPSGTPCAASRVRVVLEPGEDLFESPRGSISAPPRVPRERSGAASSRFNAMSEATAPNAEWHGLAAGHVVARRPRRAQRRGRAWRPRRRRRRARTPAGRGPAPASRFAGGRPSARRRRA